MSPVSFKNSPTLVNRLKSSSSRDSIASDSSTTTSEYVSLTSKERAADKRTTDLRANTAVKNPALSLAKIRDSIPKAAFVKSATRSILHFLFDFVMMIGSVVGMTIVCKTAYWAALPFYAQALATLAYWNIAGFFMWGIFVIGHDCGHGTFSTSVLFNDIIGHITHGSILVPYYPWQLSHRRHHMYHNHVENDYSHPWYTEERFTRDDEALARWMNQNSWVRAFFPFVGWQIYIFLGMPDGSHIIPFANTRLWKGADLKESLKCILSAAVVFANLAGIYTLLGSSVSAFAYFYLAPWVIFGWWLMSVTYLQHHSPTTVVYGDDDWDFVTAAFETVDRRYGFGIDYLTHHITDGHVAHHLFFTQIPHYNLPMATKAISKYMNENGLGHLYQFESTKDFIYRVHSYFVNVGFRATLFDRSIHSGPTATNIPANQ